MNKRITAILLILLFLLRGILPVYADEIEVVNDELENPTISISTGTQEAARERKAEIEESASEDPGADEGMEGDKADDADEAELNWERIEINNADDLIAFVLDCRLDSWSRNKAVYLNSDISLAGNEFESIPTFGGYFNGQNHVISGLYVTEGLSYVGFFSYLQRSAIVENLNVQGVIQPEGDQMIVGGIVGDNSGFLRNCKFTGIVAGSDYTGGIAGFNEIDGDIKGCNFEGSVTGVHYTGGISGENVGNISDCNNFGSINTSNEDKTYKPDEINIERYVSGLFDFMNKSEKTGSSELVNGPVDTGGIAGLSIGVIERCNNRGKVGYEHVGYNTGGIAGRQSGYITGCVNYAPLYGRKDVGGIAGQAEPYVIVDFSQDIVNQLSDNISKLHDIISVTLKNVGGESDTIHNRLSIIKDFTSKALDDTSYLADSTVDWADGMVGSVNEVISRAEYIMDEAAKDGGVIDEGKEAARDAEKAANDLLEAVRDLDIYQYMTEAQRAEYEQAKKDLESATEEHAEYVAKYTEAYENYYIDTIRADDTTTYANEQDLKPFISGTRDDTWDTTSKRGSINNYLNIEKWQHTGSEKDYPDGSDSDSELQSAVARKMQENASAISTEARTYADTEYATKNPGHTYSSDIAEYAGIIAGIVSAVTPQMSAAAKADAQEAMSHARDAFGNVEDAVEDTEDIVDYIAGRSDVRLPQLGSEYKMHTSSLVSNLQGMSDNMGYLNDEMADAADTTVGDLEKVNDQFNVIMELFTDAIDGVLDNDYSDVYEDNSLDVAETCMDATIADCSNEGRINGDINVSGIAGTMAIEYDFDLESDVTGIEDANTNSTYITKCVLRRDVNRGRVNSVKSYCGGICGLQEMGTVIWCENYGKIISDSGDHVGGIAGQSYSYIKKCYAKSALSGGSYIGGIAGSGTNISDCYTMVRVDEAKAFYGAIAGETAEDGKVHRNYFVSEDLTGIDRVSYSRKAEPIAYEDLIEAEGIPDEFRKLYINYICDDVTIETMECSYGDIISSFEYPGVADKDGYYVLWNTEQINGIKIDTDVTAEYVRYLTTLSGDILRDNGQSVILADGMFRIQEKLKTELVPTKDIPIKNVIESWRFTIPADGASEHQIRYQLPDNRKNEPDIYQKVSGEWIKLDKEMMGNFYTCKVTGDEVELAISVKPDKEKALAIGAALGAAVLLLLLAAIKIKKKKKNKNRKETEEA